MALVIKPLQDPLTVDYSYRYSLFLGGSIEMGKAEDWQTRVANALDDLPVLILNPRRDDWDASWAQDPTPGTKFHEQVEWELFGQQFCDTHAYYFCAGTKSPITLLELGMFGHSANVHIYCTPNFWRYGNVKMVCDYYGHTCHQNEETFLAALRKDLST
jgi:hypothetical protein